MTPFSKITEKEKRLKIRFVAIWTELLYAAVMVTTTRLYQQT